MKVKPMLILASLSMVISGCASDPSFNMLPPPLYERGSLEQPAGRNIASAPAVPALSIRQSVLATGNPAPNSSSQLSAL